ncbi:lytic transglycosylase domain-containing protein [Amycolatopsis sp. FDAARGOS 1241]|uniref:lytic transglycosylase domain-containing protein n=1 Tax=Amycolatopsis sp. FDAARGOS 1241 TaxID=2778070 RepID=UPI00194FF1ED|nr:lytic transglycosylase domain-containing protein [Amycolatopsis sp. FDAARGOS 1241]QRP50568.1 lytic transglycosylase domain-containing protein [Amycolatopsis sp. FDAARGOS 1241]
MAARKARYRGRRLTSRHRTVVAVAAGVLAVVPAVAGATAVAAWAGALPTSHTRDVALEQGYDPQDPQVEKVAVDGSLPQSPVPLPLPAYELPNGPLGIPTTALAAYHNAANILAHEQPGCHIDWALVASIGRIESNHARGGYVDAAGTALEPILGPELNGTGPYAAIPDTDGGTLDHDTLWDRAVGPAQFIPATWREYASDGNGDGEANPENLFDASLATARYLCSGGLDLANPDQLRTAIYRYNNSDVYVNTVILWAEAYRNGVAPLPDSQIPVGAPNAAAFPAPPAVPPPPGPATTPTTPTTPATPAQTVLPPGGGTSIPPATETTGAPTSTSPTCVSDTSSSETTPPPSSSSTSPTTTTSLPPCVDSSSPLPPPPGDGSSPTPTGNAPAP